MSTMQKMFVANKACIVNSEGKILLVRDTGLQQDHQAGEGAWDIPGGRMDKEDKTIMEALSRELKEELGLDIDISNAKIIATSLWSINGDDDRRVTAIIYKLQINEASLPIVLSNEHSDFGWFDLLEINEMTASPCVKKILNDCFYEFSAV